MRNQEIKLCILRREILFAFASCSSFMIPLPLLASEYEQTTTLAQPTPTASHN